RCSPRGSRRTSLLPASLVDLHFECWKPGGCCDPELRSMRGADRVRARATDPRRFHWILISRISFYELVELESRKALPLAGRSGVDQTTSRLLFVAMKACAMAVNPNGRAAGEPSERRR